MGDGGRARDLFLFFFVLGVLAPCFGCFGCFVFFGWNGAAEIK